MAADLSFFVNHKGEPDFILGMAEGLTVKAAAKRAGIVPRTGYRRMDDPRWQEAIKAQRALIVEKAMEYVSSNMLHVTETLMQLMENGDNDNVRLGAARTLLDTGVPKTKRVEVSGRGGGPIKASVETVQGRPDLSALSDEEAKQFLALVEKMQTAGGDDAVSG